MAIHLKNHWHNEITDKSPQATASALAFNAWRIAKDHAIKLHNQHFTYQDDKQRLTVIIEYLYFQIHIVDRLTHTMVTPEDR
ncbi:hypothetical protein TI04_10470, partial [Achromatium sp. WMS2]